MAIFEKKNGYFLAIFGHLIGNFPEGQIRSIAPERAGTFYLTPRMNMKAEH